MKVAKIPQAINKHAAIYFCMAVSFAFCWSLHHLARLTLEMFKVIVTVFKSAPVN